MHKPYSQACENNKRPILEALRREFDGLERVLEIGSGTGQHAVHFARHLDWLVWQPSDLPEAHEGIRAWSEEAGLPNLEPPIALDVRMADWPVADVDGVFSANTAHIMSWPMVEAMFAGVGRLLPAGGPFCLYGPFMYDGAHTADSNARFDAMLRHRDRDSGVREFRDLEALAGTSGLAFARDHPMPANNRLLVWRKS